MDPSPHGKSGIVAVVAPLALFLVLGLVGGLAVGWIAFPRLLYSQETQPLAFNHPLHVEAVGDECEACHFFRDDGSFSGIPDLENCAGCHEEALGETEEERKLIEEYIEPGREIPWLVYAEQPDCVHFPHAPHIFSATKECVTCHGHVAEREVPLVYERNRLTGLSRDVWGRNLAGIKRNSWDRMKMSDCAACHAAENVRRSSVQTGRGACFVCHK